MTAPSPEQDAHTVDHGKRVGTAVGAVLSLAAALDVACAVQRFVWTRQRPEVVGAEVAFLVLAAVLGLAGARVARVSVPYTVVGVVAGVASALHAVSSAWWTASLVAALAAWAGGLAALACLALWPISRRAAAARARIG